MSTRPARVVVATCRALADGVAPDHGAAAEPDDGLHSDPDAGLIAALAARGAEVAWLAWDAPAADWSAPDVVVVRSTWDYTDHLDAFVAWADSIGDRLLNPPAIVRWNADKRYLADLAAAGLAVVPTRFVEPGDATGDLAGEVVVKPTVSAGARDTGRFGPEAHDDARALIASIHRGGRTAMVQPYVRSVDERGETAVVVVDGEVHHGLRKGAVLRSEGVAPVRGGGFGAAEAMYDPDLVRAAPVGEDERAFAVRVIDHVAGRFGAVPLYARVDLVAGPDGEPMLMELELVEPDLYPAEAPGCDDRLADAILARLDGGRPR